MKNIALLFLSIAFIACSNTNSETKNSSVKKASTIKVNENKASSKALSKEIAQIQEQIEVEKSLKEPVKNVKPKKNISATTHISTPNLPAENPEFIEPSAPEIIPKIDFSGVYQAILSSYVSASGKVNYASIKKNSQMLDQAITHFQSNTPKSSWSSNQKLAYWINAYNLFTIKLIIDNYPVKSIKDIAGGKPWDKDFINLDGKIMSLNDIENGIIRKQFNEPRIHFAVNCASISCPKLATQEYTSSNLNTLLEKQTKRYISDTNENSFTKNTAKISTIFNWYKTDFEGGIIPFINKYISTPLPNDAKITYQEYNWNLNN